jgi:hypothetical protein
MTSRDDCLIRHLLYASVQAYHLDPLYSGAPRWTARRDPILGNGPRPDIDLALVGTFREGVVVAFRGTLPPLDLSPDLRRFTRPDANLLAVAADWINNAHLDLVTLNAGPIVIPGAIHQGFANSLAALWANMAAAVTPLLGGGNAPRLYFTGHSKGGALANLAALAARHAWPGATVKAVTFGAPRAGDEAFARAYWQAGIDCRRYEVVGDPVPGALKEGPLPGSLLPRALFPVGGQQLRAPIYHWPGGFFSAPDDRWKIPPPIAAHLPYPGFGYGDHACMDGLCSHDWS